VSTPTSSSIILLGSYDPDTRLVTEEAKEKIGQGVHGRPETQILTVVLDGVELYTAADPNSILLLTENSQGVVTIRRSRVYV
jgi:hypothetical protein